MPDTASLGLPLLVAEQAQKHVTHNEALSLLDALVRTEVVDRDLTAPPGSPADGSIYIPASGATGAWSTWDFNLAYYVGGAWQKIVPKVGWLVYVVDEDKFYKFEGSPSFWVEFSAGGGGSIAVDDEGSEEVAAATRLNFTGAGVTASDAGSGVVDITIPGGGGSGREVLTANRTYYVRSDGDDGNDGLTDSSGGGFATLQKAVDTVAGLDLGVYDATIQISVSGTYVGATLKTLVGAGMCHIVGDTGTPSNVVLDNGGGGNGVALLGEGLAVTFFGRYSVAGVKFADASDVAIYIAGFGAFVDVSNVEFGACNHHMRASYGAQINLSGNYTINGNCGRHIWAETKGVITEDGGFTVTISGTPAWGNSFADSREMSIIRHTGWTFSGASTGQRYKVTENSVIQTAGGGASYFPGDAAGSAANGGLFL